VAFECFALFSKELKLYRQIRTACKRKIVEVCVPVPLSATHFSSYNKLVNAYTRIVNADRTEYFGNYYSYRRIRCQADWQPGNFSIYICIFYYTHAANSLELPLLNSKCVQIYKWFLFCSSGYHIEKPVVHIRFTLLLIFCRN